MRLNYQGIRLSLLLLSTFAASAKIIGNYALLQEQTFDFVVVGGGTAGNVIANRLSENPFWSVLVLEAGGSNENVTELMVPGFAPRLPRTSFDWNFTSIEQAGLNGRSVPVTRGFVLGGSSSINFMGYTRGSADDFDRLASISEDNGWSWKQVLPYIRKNEKFILPLDPHDIIGRIDPSVHGFTGINSVSLRGFPLHDFEGRLIQTSQELTNEFPFTEDMNQGNQLGVGWVQATIGNGTRSSSAASYLGPEFINRPNLHVLVNARVTRILQAHGQDLKFSGVEFTQDGGETLQRVNATKEIILSAGTIMSPQILLHSGIGNSTELSALGVQPTHDLPSVGRNLTDHPFLASPWQVNSTETFDTAARDPELAGIQLNQWESNRTGPLVNPPLAFIGWLRLNETADIFGQVEDPSAGNRTAHFELIFVNGLAGAPVPPTGNFLTVGTAVVSPTSNGAITINSTNALDDPVIDFNLLTSEFDIFTMREAFRSAVRFLSSSAWDGFIIAPPTNATSDDELNAYIRQRTGTIFHPVGTAAMSPRGASWGVVDPDLRVKGVEGLRVVDASVFPKIPAAHTQAPTYIIAERASGAAGNVIANRLSENPFWSVLLLEAGGSNENVTELMVPAFAPRLGRTAFDWNFTSTPQAALNDRSVPVTRGFVLGGSTSINFMAYTRGSADEFNRLANITEDSGWSWDEILPYIRKNEKFIQPPTDSLVNITGKFDPSVHGFTGVNSVSLGGFPLRDIQDRVIQTTQELSDEFPFNLDMNKGDQIGFGWGQATVGNGSRSSSAVSYLGPEFISRPNLHVLLNARVTRVLQDDNQNLSFSGVEFTQDGGASTHRVNVTKEIILSAGSIMSPHILLHSGIGNSTELMALGIQPIHDLPSVGRNLSEHPFLDNPWLVNSNETSDTAARNPQLANDELEQWQTNRTGPLVDAPVAFIGWLRLNETSEIFCEVEDPAAGNGTAHIELFFVNGFVGTLPPTGNFLTLGNAVVSPTSRGTVTINSTNPLDAPLVDLNLLTTDFDMFTLREGFRFASRFLSSSAWDGFIISAPTNATTDDELDEYIRDHASGFFHPVGTVAMSPRGADWGVVDPDLRVKGVSGLRVVDSSVFPKIPAAHTQVPTYIVAERASDLIKETWFV
ncbi:hypothetical protein VNI00_009922 [Paramarasmius palmivorus]|uniref:Glucose-methanol-choline oxidoreductase N-terminal domain-containing protein n=1 Tax=Paramarasmius palmivorus TaxID=297713 RepID=A0AAW0CNT8_9AGAR